MGRGRLGPRPRPRPPAAGRRFFLRCRSAPHVVVASPARRTSIVLSLILRAPHALDFFLSVWLGLLGLSSRARSARPGLASWYPSLANDARRKSDVCFGLRAAVDGGNNCNTCSSWAGDGGGWNGMVYLIVLTVALSFFLLGFCVRIYHCLSYCILLYYPLACRYTHTHTRSPLLFFFSALFVP